MDTSNHSLPAQAKMLEEAKARRAKALAMHNAGKKNREIAEALGGMTPERARQLVAKAKQEAGL